MKLYINPFLDVFYEWGRKQGYWVTRGQVIAFLNGTPMNENWEELEISKDEALAVEALYTYPPSNALAYEDYSVPIVPIRDYLEENVPEWYYRHGWSMWIGGHTEGLLGAWERDSPIPYNPDVYAQWLDDRVLNRDYPRELVLTHDGSDGLGHLTGKEVQMQLLEGSYVQIVSGAPFDMLNSLYFTTVKGQSWCNVSSPSRFINWTEGPFEEVKE